MEFDLPQLRPDLELLVSRPEEPTGLLLYDSARREIYELPEHDLPVLRLLDGTHRPQDIARLTRRRLDDILDLLDDLADLMLLSDPELEDLLQTCRREHEQDDRLLQPILDSVPSEEATALPLHVVDDARHDCLCCGACCHYAVPISAEERRRLESVTWPAQVIPAAAGSLFQVRPSTQWGQLEGTIATRVQPTRCAFLDSENLCRIHAHARLGPSAKPFSCRLFPLSYPVLAGDRVIVSLTFECPWIYCSYDAGEPLSSRREELAALVAEMEVVYSLPASLPLNGATTLSQADYLAWETATLAVPARAASDPASLLERWRQQWTEMSPLGKSPIAGPGDLAELAEALGHACRQNRSVLADSPEGEAGSAWAGKVLEALAVQPGFAWAALPWEDGAAADSLLRHFVRHFVEGKQHLFYQPLALGVRALVLLLLLSRADAGLTAQKAGDEQISLGTLNRALARWSRLLDIRPLRLTFLKV